MKEKGLIVWCEFEKVKWFVCDKIFKGFDNVEIDAFARKLRACVHAYMNE